MYGCINKQTRLRCLFSTMTHKQIGLEKDVGSRQMSDNIKKIKTKIIKICKGWRQFTLMKPFSGEIISIPQLRKNLNKCQVKLAEIMFMCLSYLTSYCSWIQWFTQKVINQLLIKQNANYWLISAFLQCNIRFWSAFMKLKSSITPDKQKCKTTVC